MDVRSTRAGFVGAALTACLVGLLGADGGILWIVGGVFTVRFVWGRDPGVGWAIACVAAGLRWGTLGLADVEAATRLIGPTVAVGNVAMRTATAVALAAGLMDEMRIGTSRSGSVAERAASAIALATLVPLFVAPGPGSLTSAAWWLGAALALGTAAWLGSRPAARVPRWLPAALASASALTIGSARCLSC